MRKLLSTLGTFFALGIFNTPAFAAYKPEPYYSADKPDPYYISVNIGRDVTPTKLSSSLNQETITTDAGIDIVGAFGLKFDMLRIEAEAGYHGNKAKEVTNNTGTYKLNGDFGVTSFLVNGYLDLNDDGIDPYLTAGAGVANVNFSNVNKTGDPAFNTISDVHSTLAFQLGAGIAIPLSKHLEIDARYRYFATRAVSINNGDYKLPGNSVLVGLKIGLQSQKN